MPRFCANLTMLFTEHDFIDRFAAAHNAGFVAVEFMFPYGHTIEQLSEAIAATSLQVVLHNFPAGNWLAGDRGLAATPSRRTEFRDSVDLAILYAQALSCQQLNCLAGLRDSRLSSTTQYDCLLENLDFAATKLQQAGIRCLLEPINNFGGCSR